MLERYIFRSALIPFLAALSALGAIALLTQSISTLDLIIDQRQSLFTYVEITTLALPQLVSIVLPIALFIAAIYSLNRLQGDSELVVCQSAGMSRWRLTKPILQLAVAAVIANLVINLWVQPTSFRHMREKLYEVRADLAAKLVRPGQFRSPADGLVFYVRDVERGGRVVDLLIEDTTDPENPVTYMAKSGVFTERGGEPTLTMYDGSAQSLNENGTLSFLKFDSYPLILSQVVNGPGNLFYKLSDRYLHELLFPDFSQFWEWRSRAELYAEGHYRLASPLYNIALALIAAAAVLGGEYRRTGNARRIAYAAAAALVTRSAGFAVQSACADNPALNPLQYAVPLGAAAIAAFILLAPRMRRVRRKPPKAREPQRAVRAKEAVA